MSTSSLRSRQTAASNNSPPLTPTFSESESEAAKSRTHSPGASLSRTRISVLDILRVLGGLVLLSCTLSYFITTDSFFWGYGRPSFTRLPWLKAKWHGELLLTEEELSRYNGTDPSLPIYLALNSSIYDVSAGPRHYGPGGTYHFFAGRDATRAFVTGCFDEDLTGDLRGAEEMFVPLDLDEEPTFAEGVSEEEKRRVRREWKGRKERAWRKARAKVRDVVEGWRTTYDKGPTGKYFWVGRVYRPNGFEGPKRRLCKPGQAKRPKNSDGV